MMCVSLAGAAQAISPATQSRLLSRPLHHRHPLTTISASPSSHCPRRSSLPLTPAVASRPRTVTAAASEAVAAEAAAAAEALEALLDAPEIEYEEKELGFEYRKPRLALKFIWREKNIGVALDHVIHGHGNVPLSPYYFWPRKDAWEELKVVLESKPWITKKRVIILLNQATDIINLWQQSGAGSLQQ